MIVGSARQIAEQTGDLPEMQEQATDITA